MNTIILAIGIIKNGEKVLLRKKPDGSLPYKETWYLFGGELNSEDQNPEQVLKGVLKKQAGIEIKVVGKIGRDAEIKLDHNGDMASFIYVDFLCEYISGDLVPGEGIEKLEWVSIYELSKYDLVPPSVKLFKKIGYL